MTSLSTFRRRVLGESLFAPCGLKRAVGRMGFVQADPIRSPARAQDLILRHRVTGYRAGDLERRYPKLGLEEGYLYAYGFMPESLWRVVHPRPGKPLTEAERRTLEVMEREGPMGPGDLEAHLGAGRERNYWGGFSRKAKLAMESLHNRGMLRVARRDNGVRVYERAGVFEQTLSAEERFREILLAALGSMGPTTDSFLLSGLNHFRYLVGEAAARRRCLRGLIGEGKVRVDRVDGVEYVSRVVSPSGQGSDGPAGRGRSEKNRQGPRRAGDGPAGRGRSAGGIDGVRILAPFDPVVRDRRRFEHLWGWKYRFEAYTPKAKRTLGYYAMPVLWRDDIVGWANASVEGGRLRVELGYAEGRPEGRGYREAAEEEVARLAVFLGLGEGDWEVEV